MSLTTPAADQILDLTGMYCPYLIITTIKALRPMQPNQILQIIATDLNASSSISAWYQQSDNELLEMYEENGRFIFYLHYTPTPNPTSPDLNQQGITYDRRP